MSVTASGGRTQIVKANKLILLMEGEINKSVVNTYLKMQIPMLWMKFFMNIANNSDFVNSFCNNTCKKFHRYCCDWYIYNLMKGNNFLQI